jgi:UDP-glucose 4-epimerase
MRFLVTGGAGFLGAALANRLSAAGHDVRAIDDLSAGDPARLSPAVLFTRGDVADVPRLWSLLQDIDCVYHLAARVSVPESLLYPREYNAVNVGGTVAVMEAMRDAGVKRVVFTSSGAVYGEQARQPVAEDAMPDPASPYAAGKLSAEHYVRTIGRLWGLETVSLRLFNVYGPGQPLPASHPPVIPQFLRQAQRGGSLVVFGSGAQTRDFVYRDDAIDALVAAASAPAVDQAVLNIGAGRETSLTELVATIARVAGRAIEPLYNTAGSPGVSRLCADIRLARERLGFEPRVTLEDGLRRMVAEDPRFASGRGA